MLGQFHGDDIVLERALAFWIHRVNQALRAATYRAFRDAGLELTPEQWMVLVRLWSEDGRTPAELAAATFRDRPTMTRVLDVMEREGLVVRRTDARDARSRRVFLTAEGKRLRKVLVPRARTVVATMEHGIAPAELEQARAVLERLAANLET